MVFVLVFCFHFRFLFFVDFNSFLVSHYLKMMTLQPWAQCCHPPGWPSYCSPSVCVRLSVCVCKCAEATPTRSPGAALDAVSFNLHFKRFLLHTLHLLVRSARGKWRGRRGWLFGYVLVLAVVVVVVVGVVQLLPLLLLVIKLKLIFLFKVFGLLALRSISLYTRTNI